MRQLKRNLLSVALASASVLMTPGVYAQATTPADQDEQTAEERAAARKKQEEAAKALDTVTVVGIAAGLERALDTKRESDAIVEAISSEDIGKLPDVSIADSIARLPGLTAQRFGGRAQEINIRGFSGDFSTTTLNGREQVSLGNNRGVEFDQYPSELTSGVIVYKTQQANLVGQGLSGTIDLKTIRPLDYQDRIVALNLRGDMNKVGDEKKYGGRFSISYIDQFRDNTVGLALGYARLNNPYQSNQFNAWGYDDAGTIGGLETFNFDGENVRDGAFGTLEFRPNDWWISTLDVFYSQFDKDEQKRGLQYGAGGFTNVQRTGSGVITSATLNGVSPVVVRNDYNYAHDDLFSIGWRNEFTINDAWKLSADLSHSEAEREERILETYAQIPGSSNTIQIRRSPEGYYNQTFGLDYGNPSLLRLIGPSGWGQDGYDKTFMVEDEINSGRIDLDYSFTAGPVSSLEFGANRSDRTKSRAADEAFLCISQTACGDGSSLPVPASTSTDFPFAGIGRLYGYNALDAAGLYRRRSNSNRDISFKNWEVEEQLTTYYVQANIDTEFLGAPLRGNVGVQAVQADQESTGVAIFQGATLSQPATRGARYTTYLPSFNLRLSLPDELYIRFAGGRQMARPRMDQLRGSAEYSYNAAPTANNPYNFSGNGGNPLLRPWLAEAIDIGFEKYFADTGYFSVNLFNKELLTYIYDYREFIDFGTLPLPAGVVAIPPGTPTQGFYSTPINGQGGSLHGFEFALSIPFKMFWEPLDGLGFTANYSEISSKISPVAPPDAPTNVDLSQPIPGLSKYVSNMSVFYERAGFSARVSQRARSDFRGEVQGFGGDRATRDFVGERVTDLQLGYTIQEGALKDLGFVLQLYNLENEPFVENARQTINGVSVTYPDRVASYSEYGRTYLLGISYKF